jgi:hypothetical protein
MVIGNLKQLLKNLHYFLINNNCQFFKIKYEELWEYLFHPWFNFGNHKPKHS